MAAAPRRSWVCERACAGMVSKFLTVRTRARRLRCTHYRATSKGDPELSSPLCCAAARTAVRAAGRFNRPPARYQCSAQAGDEFHLPLNGNAVTDPVQKGVGVAHRQVDNHTAEKVLQCLPVPASVPGRVCIRHRSTAKPMSTA